MSFRDRILYVLVLLAVCSAIVVLVLSIAEALAITSVSVDRLIKHPAYWVVAAVIGWFVAPFLSKRLPAKRWWQ